MIDEVFLGVRDVTYAMALYIYKVCKQTKNDEQNIDGLVE